MGQKSNPRSLRLQINKNWKSRWFSKKNYPKYILEDYIIRKEVKEKFQPATIESVEIERERGGDIKIIIYTPKPGVVIGRSGKGTEELKKFIDKKIKKNVKIEILEVDKQDLRAQIVAENIGFQISRRIPYRRAVNMAIDRAKEAGAKGIRIIVAGRLNGADISRREKFSWGSVPTQTLKKEIDFAVYHAPTKFGIIGIKIWIFV